MKKQIQTLNEIYLPLEECNAIIMVKKRTLWERRITDNDFFPLIESALQAKGFAKGQQRKNIKVGFSEDNLNNFLNKILNEDFKNLLIIGHSSLNTSNNDYFKKMFSLIPNSTYAITLANNPNLDNVMEINLGNDYAQIYGVLQKIFERIPINSEKLAFFMTKCDVNSFSNIINLKNEGAKNIFLSDCPPTLINPSVLSAFNKDYDIYPITTPAEDLKILK